MLERTIMSATTVLRARTRNFGIIAHIDAGKTTLSERILLKTGQIHRSGEVHEGTATMDSMDLEKERGITIGAAATSVTWKEHAFTLIDTPGHIDFAIEVERSLRVLDGAVTVLDSVAGVQPQTETVWRQAHKHGVPMVVFVNKMDRIGADFGRVVEQLRTRLGANPVPLLIPVGAADTFAGTLDVLGARLLSWTADGLMSSAPVPAHLAQVAADAYVHAAAVAAEASDELTLRYLETDTLPVQDIEAGLRILTLARTALPVLAGSAYRNAGVEPLLDAIIAWLPSPDERAAQVASVDGEAHTVGTADGDPLAALVFKVVHDEHGSLSYVRVYGGTLREGDLAWNASLRQTVRIGRLYVVHADRRSAVATARAGSIVAIAGLKDALTGHTLSTRAVPLVLETISAGEPVVALAIEAGKSGERAKMLATLERFRREDPSLRLENDAVSGETVLWGMGELHLDVVLERVRREAGIEVKVGAPQVAYRETIAGKAVEVEGKLSKQNGGVGQYARVLLKVEPWGQAQGGAGFVFENAIKGGVVPAVYIPAVEKGIRQALAQGPLGYPVSGVKVTLIDGDYHAVDSSDLAFTLAAKEGTLAGLRRAGPLMLEPVMKVTVDAPAANAGDVIGDLQRRSGRVLGIEEHTGRVEVIADVPLARLFGHTGSLRSLSQGRAFASAVYARHAPRVAGEALAATAAAA